MPRRSGPLTDSDGIHEMVVPVAATRVVAMLSSPSPCGPGAPVTHSTPRRRQGTTPDTGHLGCPCSHPRAVLHTVGAMVGGPPRSPQVEDVASLDRAIAGLESQRSLLGDDIVETALAPLRERRAALVMRQAGEQRKLVTVLFADVVDFTVLSRRLDAEDTRAVVGAYFSRWHDVITAQGGTVEKFIGDAVMAVFGLAQSWEDDAQRAVRTALAMTEGLAELNVELEERYGVTLQMRVGID